MATRPESGKQDETLQPRPWRYHAAFIAVNRFFEKRKGAIVAYSTAGLFLLALVTFYFTLRTHAESILQQDREHMRNTLRYLERTESRYSANDGSLVWSDKEEELALRQLAAKEQGVVKVFFRLAQVSEIVGHRHEQRSRNVDIGGISVPQNYTVRTDVVRNVPVRADVSAFGCVSCNSRERLDFYLIAQAGIESYTPTATDWVRLARAAVDFGESYKAEEYLRVAEDLVAPSQSPVYRARSLEEIGKTYIIMRNSDKGKLLLEQAKSLWRTSKLDSQVGGLHDILVWEAQYASSQGDINTAGQRLAEMSEVVARYDLAESITSRMIHDAHAVCLTLLANKNNFDPALPVPPEYRTYAPAFCGWVSPHQIARTIDLIQIIPVGIETDVLNLPDAQPGLMQAELARALELFLGAMDGALPSPESSSPTPPTED
jgi:hypothetical protein